MHEEDGPRRYRLEDGFANFTAIPNEVLRSTTLSGNAKALYAILIDVIVFQRDEPGQVELGQLLGGSDKTARTALKELHEAGLLEANRPGQGKPNEYILMRPQGGTENGQNLPEGGSATSDREVPSVLVKTVKDKSARDGQKNRRQDPVWDAFVLIFGSAPAGRTERARWNAAAKDLRDEDASGEDVMAAAAAYRAHPTFRDCILTPHALAANWTLLTATPKSSEDLAKVKIARELAEWRVEQERLYGPRVLS